MRLTVIIRTLGVLFLLFSTALLVPIGIAFFYNEPEIQRILDQFGVPKLTVTK